MVLKAVLLAVSDRSFLRLEIDPDLRVGVARPVPASQRVRPLRLLSLELEQPLSGIGLPGLGCLALKFYDPRHRHERHVAK
jgi:hypothetical protein